MAPAVVSVDTVPIALAEDPIGIASADVAPTPATQFPGVPAALVVQRTDTAAPPAATPPAGAPSWAANDIVRPVSAASVAIVT